MRMDQPQGLPKNAKEFLTQNVIRINICPSCGKDDGYKKEKIGEYHGMFEEPYPLYRYHLKDGRTADTYLQASPWSSGPVMFEALKISDGTIFSWPDEIIERA